MSKYWSAPFFWSAKSRVMAAKTASDFKAFKGGRWTAGRSSVSLVLGRSTRTQKSTCRSSDLDHREEEDIEEVINATKPFEFGHSLEDQIGGQLNAGFLRTGSTTSVDIPSTTIL